jgi:electron transfer flavoprotein beta subunit
MKIAVCVKQIPDPATPYSLDPETNFVVRPDDQVLDDTDRYGVEVGLQLVEQIGEGASLTLLSMTPSGTLAGIRQALAMGADRAIVIDDDTLRGADALTTAKVLAAALNNDDDPFDLVIAGCESTDGYSGVMPQQLAELLGIPSLSFARKVERQGANVRIERQTEAGYDVVEAPLPVLLTVTAGVVEPRYPNFKGIMQAKKKPVDTKTCADLGIDPAVQQTIQSVEPIQAREAGEIIEDEGDAYLRIVEKLEELKVV